MNVNIELTDHCNIACRMCSQSMREEAHGAPMRFMDFPTWRAGILGLAGMEDVALCPHWLGEPTLHPRFDELVEYAFTVNGANRLFRTFKLHTNGVILSPDRAARLVRLANAPGQAVDTFPAIHFSIDAFSRDAYQYVKGADRRELVYRNVERFLELRGASARPYAHLAMVVQPGNRHEVAAFVAHWSAVLTRLHRPFHVTSDWPSFSADGIYLRRLNAGDQGAADQLHREACQELGVPVTDHRMPGSF